MREIRTSGSVGAPGGNPRATRLESTLIACNRMPRSRAAHAMQYSMTWLTTLLGTSTNKLITVVCVTR